MGRPMRGVANGEAKRMAGPIEPAHCGAGDVGGEASSCPSGGTAQGHFRQSGAALRGQAIGRIQPIPRLRHQPPALQILHERIDGSLLDVRTSFTSLILSAPASEIACNAVRTRSDRTGSGGGAPASGRTYWGWFSPAAVIRNSRTSTIARRPRPIRRRPDSR